MLARRGVHAEVAARVEAEVAAHGDVVWLATATEGCFGVTWTKMYEFWRFAATLPPTVTHVAKTEDDVVLHVPNLLADLASWRAQPRLYYGLWAWAGLTPAGRACGFGWTGYDPARCPAGSLDGTLFATGPLEVLSVDLARLLASDDAVAAFVERAAREANGGRTDEDVLLGVWIAHARATTPGLTVTYASPPDNSRFLDFYCVPGSGLYQVPHPGATVNHRIKLPRLVRYTWRLIAECRPHNRSRCWEGERLAHLTRLVR